MVRKVPRTDIWPSNARRRRAATKEAEATLVLMMVPVGLLSLLLLRWMVMLAPAVATPVPAERVGPVAAAGAVVAVEVAADAVESHRAALDILFQIGKTLNYVLLLKIRKVGFRNIPKVDVVISRKCSKRHACFHRFFLQL